MKLRLSLRIPLLLLIISIISSLVVYVQESNANKARLEKEAIVEATLQMGQLQNILYNRLTEGDWREAQLNISLAAMHPGIRSLLLADDSDRVMLSNHFSWHGEHADTYSRYSGAEAHQVLQRGTSKVLFDKSEPALLQGYFPLVVQYRRGGLEKRMGVLYFERDISALLAEARQQSLKKSLIVAGISLLAALLIAWMLHRMVSRRVNVLLDASRRLSSGDYSVQTRMSGDDELVELGDTFDVMARSIDSNSRLREQARLEQEKSNARNQLYLDMVQALMVALDERGHITMANRSACELLGYSEGELLGKNWFESCLPQPQGMEVVYPVFLRLIAGDAVVEDEYENYVLCRDGRWRLVVWRNTLLKDAEGKVIGTLSSGMDITERKQVEIELEKERIFLQEAQQIGRFGSWELNLVSGNLAWSDEIFQMFEIEKTEFGASYEAFLKAIHPEDRESVSRAYAKSLVDKLPYNITHRLLMADGRVKWVEERCISDFDADGKPLRSLGTVQDVTEREEAAVKLRVAAAAFETHEAIMITDADANIIRINHAFTQITGYSSEEVVGQNPRILSSGRQDKAFYQSMWQQLLATGAWTGEIWDKRKSGQIYPKWLTITAVKDTAGRVSEYVAIFSDITERKQAEEEIRNLAFFDALTRLPNRRLLQDRFRQALTISARNHQYGAILFLDMDHFKTLNDTLGHDYGDLMLIEVAKRIQDCVRESDTVARLGGDEFVVLLEELSADQEEATQKVALVAEKIRASLNKTYQLRKREYHSSPSVGVCLYRGTGESIDTLLKHADMAMYQAKGAGRNAVQFYDPAMQKVVEGRVALESDLRRAIEGGQLELFYQAQVDNDLRVFGAEALLRWHHPTQGMVPPSRFIPIAEESSLILDIGHWVMERACQQLAVWRKNEQTRHLVLAINISAQQFRRRDLTNTVMSLIDTYGIDPAHLKLELTESVVLGDVADVVAKMHALKALGVKISLDDFGTGYSSLSYLKQLPLDQIKIDQSFVRDIVSDPGDAVMVKAIIDMAKNFRLNVIAEGVETMAQLDFLKQQGCVAYQGYYFSKPVSVTEFEGILND